VINLVSNELHAVTVGGCVCLLERSCGGFHSVKVQAEAVADGRKARCMEGGCSGGEGGGRTRTHTHTHMHTFSPSPSPPSLRLTAIPPPPPCMHACRSAMQVLRQMDQMDPLVLQHNRRNFLGYAMCKSRMVADMYGRLTKTMPLEVVEPCPALEYQVCVCVCVWGGGG
jgi:hypothetical protein